MEVGERWKSIASRVPGKTKRECVERFKELNQILKQQQQQQQQQSAPAELKYAENAAGTLRAEGAARNRSAAGGVSSTPSTNTHAGFRLWLCSAPPVWPCECVARWRRLTCVAVRCGGSMVPLPDAPYPLQQGKGAEQHTMCTFLQQQAKAPTAAGPAAPVLAAGGVRAGGWSEEEAAALQAALNEFAEASMGKQERWRRIAIRVPSKSIKQCYDKVREMRAALQRGLDQQLKAGAASKSASAKPKSALVKFSLDSAREGAGGEQVVEEADSDEPISGDDDDDEEEEGEESEGEGDEGEKSHIRPLEEMDASGRVSLTGHHRGTQLKLNDLLLQGVSVAQFAAARVQCACNRCSLKFDVLLARGKELEEDCPRCRMARTVRLRSDVLHANNHSAGYVDTEGCTVLDLLPSDLWLACDACGAETCHRRLQRGKRSEEVCRGCYAKLSVGFGKGVSSNAHATGEREQLARRGRRPDAYPFAILAGQVGIVRLDAARTDAGANGAKRNKGGQQSKERELVVGTPLPNRGTCDHYKRSTRWLVRRPSSMPPPRLLLACSAGGGTPPGPVAAQSLRGCCAGSLHMMQPRDAATMRRSPASAPHHVRPADPLAVWGVLSGSRVVARCIRATFATRKQKVAARLARGRRA